MQIDRRGLLRAGLGLLGGAALSACGGGSRPAAAPSFVTPTGEQVLAAERSRRTGPVRDFRLVAAESQVDLGGPVVRTWTYDGRVPGTPIRVRAGEVVRARLANRLPQDTSVHWHGLALRNDADGVPGVTQQPIASGAEHVYEFAAAHPGTYWFHPHSGTQLDRGLYAPLIVDDPREPLAYDDEWIVVLDDWLDGVTGTPEDVLAELSKGMGGMSHGSMGHGGSPSSSTHMMMGATSLLLGGDAGDVRYPHFLLNGRVPASPETFRAKPGSRVRIRVVNAGGDTAFRVALAGHRLTVTHTDGFPVRPAEADALLVGMGERYDVLVTLKDGVFPLVALAEGKDGLARALVRASGAASAPAAGARPRELDGDVARYSKLQPAEQARLAPKSPTRSVRLELTGSMMAYDWAINGRRYDPSVIHAVRSGERVRLSFVNRTTMWHPMHLHGHTFALAGSGVRKDTAIVLPGATLDVDFDADNPGLWMIHCHNIYHAESGMMTLLGYQRT
ncbi:multicopper oxidase family protein [Nonomuraea pusilla]|uniref:Multicopper oxidase with three cupredoxin domains (Includes cell division protein FtsP and spore coat protein CotA) n=1 Tax=Nonomuraea pusilla TaxID=46177 RepID=A0A1H7QP83_9ACTN|nr:multicopper oxidase family protein [Nonomuraea pusilla]SEL49811.1 Multicopper oxidase with three cupredoxin domains (includes cell division protein FtsP and spore coat protein CotA) [Nonomuraea pusilla]